MYLYEVSGKIPDEFKHIGPAPVFELMRWSMAERFGWTLDYIDSLSMADIHEFFQIEDGRAKADAEKKPKKPPSPGPRSRTLRRRGRR